MRERRIGERGGEGETKSEREREEAKKKGKKSGKRGSKEVSVSGEEKQRDDEVGGSVGDVQHQVRGSPNRSLEKTNGEGEESEGHDDNDDEDHVYRDDYGCHDNDDDDDDDGNYFCGGYGDHHDLVLIWALPSLQLSLVLISCSA